MPEAIIGAVIIAVGSIVASQVAKPNLPPPPVEPTEEEIALVVQKRKKKIQQSQANAAERLAALGPIQLEAPTLGF